MYEKSYVIRKNHDGYAVYELGVKEGRVTSEAKIVEHDFLVIAIHKLAHHLQLTCPDYKLFKSAPSEEDRTPPGFKLDEKTQPPKQSPTK